MAPKTVHGIGTLFRQIFRRAVKWGYLENNPLDFMDLPEGSTRRQKRPRSLSPAEYLALVELYGPRERAAIEVAGWLGPRRSEGFGLKWQDLDFERKIVSFRQGFVSGRVTPLKTEASQADVSMPEDVMNALFAWRKITPYRAPGDWVFASPITKGKRPFWPESMLKRIIQPIAQKNGFGRIGWHTFRHSFVSWGKAVLKLEETKELARHQNLQTTSEKYGELSLTAKRAASDRLVKYVKQSALAENEEKQLRLTGMTPASGLTQ